MTTPDLPRILIVDDEEAILETMTFTFMDVYEVITSDDAAKALSLMDEYAPVSVVITDQRMPGMTGVELLEQVYARHPETVRIMLTGFADSEATIKAINEGHVYAYINKPWEPDELKQVVKRAVEHHALTVENHRLVDDLTSVNSIMEAVMDRLDLGAIAIDRDGIVRAANKPARAYLALDGRLRGKTLDAILAEQDLGDLAESVTRMARDQGCAFEDYDIEGRGQRHRLRVSAQQLTGPDEEPLGRVLLFKEISHEPLRRSFDEIIAGIASSDDGLREHLEGALVALGELGSEVQASGISSSSMSELSERVSRCQTAIQNWLDVDDAMAREEYPDAQLLLDRMRVASQRWPRSEELPARITKLADSVEAYYESGENARERVL
jgi:FixJ family two-component response regulator